MPVFEDGLFVFIFRFWNDKSLFYNNAVKHLQKILFSSALLCLCLSAHPAYAQDVKLVPMEGAAIRSMANIDLNDMKQRIEKLEKQLTYHNEIMTAFGINRKNESNEDSGK